jgi:hypothetical protein
MKQCLNCKFRLFFKPLPDEAFTACIGWGESVRDINIRTGVSPKIKQFGQNEEICERFDAGISICQANEKSPFLINPVRKDGEQYLLKLLDNTGR